MHFNFRHLYSQSATMLFLLFSVALHFPGDWRNTKVLTRVNTMTRNITTRWSILPHITKTPKGNLDIPVIRVTAKFKTVFPPSFPGLSLFRQNTFTFLFAEFISAKLVNEKFRDTDPSKNAVVFIIISKYWKTHQLTRSLFNHKSVIDYFRNFYKEFLNYILSNSEIEREQ